MSSEKQKFSFFFVRSSEMNQIEEILKETTKKELDPDFEVEIDVNDSLLIDLKDSFEQGEVIGLSVRDNKCKIVGLVTYDIDDEVSIDILNIWTYPTLFEEVMKQCIFYLRNKYGINITITLEESLDPILLKRITSNMKYIKCDESGLIYDVTNYK